MSVSKVIDLFPELASNEKCEDYRIISFANTKRQIIFHKDSLNMTFYYKGIQFDEYDEEEIQYLSKYAEYHKLFLNDKYMVFEILKIEIDCESNYSGDSEDNTSIDITSDESIYYGSFVADNINDVIKEFIKIFNDCDILESTIIHKFSYDWVRFENSAMGHTNQGFTLPNNDYILKKHEPCNELIWHYGSFDQSLDSDIMVDSIDEIIRIVEIHYPKYIIEKSFKPVIDQ